MSRSPAPAGDVPTYRGDVAGIGLGCTLPHEHLFVLAPELDTDYPHPEWDPEQAVEAAVRRLDALHHRGVRTLVDLTVPGLGRDVGLVGRVARRTAVNIVAATGWYTDTVLPPALGEHGPGRLVDGPDPLLEMFRRDVVEGIGGTGVRAGALKVVTGAAGPTPDVVRVLAAAAEVHRDTGTAIFTHADPAAGTGADQVQLLARHGADLSRVVIGHSGDAKDLDVLLGLADAGVMLGMDRFGMRHTGDDAVRVQMVVELLRRGYAGQMLLSTDSAIFSRVTPPSWRRVHCPDWAPSYLLDQIVPRLRAAGATDRDLEQMMVDNPRRVLAGPGGGGR